MQLESEVVKLAYRRSRYRSSARGRRSYGRRSYGRRSYGRRRGMAGRRRRIGYRM